MSITLELTSEQQARLQQEAAQRGLTLEEYLVSVIESEAAHPVTKKTPAEIRAQWKRDGLTPMWQDIPEDSPELVRKWRYSPREGESE